MDLMSGVAITKQIYDLLQTIKEGRDQKLVSDAAGNLSEKITALQMLNTELSGFYHSECQKTMKLSQENSKIKMFISNIEHYALHKTPAGSITYIPKDTPDNEVPLYYACAHCYQKAIVSMLQPDKRDSGFHMLYCPECKNKFKQSLIPLKSPNMPNPFRY
ncbi:hypothetical protein [Rosenbergiella epipactidis]|uniref:hypothetical protein n=1 Tax=Rosenbergiella epipactidis TaxID=1544694 RepID=UPI001F4D71C6|nr:hypothetical protein [Rosenbergiella epipactidis]